MQDAISNQVINQREDYIAMQEEVKDGDYLYVSEPLEDNESIWYVTIKYKDCRRWEHTESFHISAVNQYDVLDLLATHIDNHPGITNTIVQMCYIKVRGSLQYNSYNRETKSYILTH